MAFKDLFKTSPLESKASIGAAQMLVGKDYSHPERGLENYSKDGYEKNPTVFACIDLISTCFGSVPLRVYDDSGEEIQDSPLKKLLDRPNPDEGGEEFRTAAASWMLLSGNCFTEKIMTGGTPSELWNWQPYEMSVARSSASRMPSKYYWRKDMSGTKSWAVNPIDGSSDMMHWRKFNPSPEDSTFGMSPMKAAAISGDTYNSSMQWRYNQVNGGGVMDGLLSPKGPATMDEKQKSSFIRMLKEKFKGPAKSGNRIGLSSVEMTYTPMVSSMKDAEWLDGTKLSKQEICEVYRVPTQLLGIEGSQSYANFETAMKSLHYLATIPLLNLYCGELNRGLGAYFPNQKVGWSKNDLDALEPDRAERRKQKVESKAYSINEIRQEFGDEPRDEPEADFVMTNPSEIPLGMDVFMPEEKPAKELAKSMMAMGVPRAEAEQKALEISHGL